MKTTLGILSLAGLALFTAHGQSPESVETPTNQTRQADVLHLDQKGTQQVGKATFRFQTDMVTAQGQSTEAFKTATNQTGKADMLPLDPKLTQERIEAMFRFQTDMVTRVFGVDVTVDGIIPRLLRAEQPLQLINPLAPPEYGIGEEILSFHPLTRRVEGFSFFTFRF